MRALLKALRLVKQNREVAMDAMITFFELNRDLAARGTERSGGFYPATPKFSLLRACNTWVAEALESAGVPVSPRKVITAGNLARQLAPLALRPR